MTRAIVLAGALLLALAGCGGDQASKTGPIEQKLPDGRTVVCVLYDGYREASISCDWGHAK